MINLAIEMKHFILPQSWIENREKAKRIKVLVNKIQLDIRNLLLDIYNLVKELILTDRNTTGKI